MSVALALLLAPKSRPRGREAAEVELYRVGTWTKG